MNAQCRIRTMAVSALVLLLSAVSASEISLTIPRAQRAPKMDGRIVASEWADAAAVSGMISQLDKVADPRACTFWITYDAENVYIAQRSTVREREWSPKTPSLWFGKDSSFVIGLAPGRVNRGDTPSHYLMRVNLDGQRRAYEIAWKLAGVKIRFPHPAWKVKPVIKHSFRRGRILWESEVAIPLDSMNVKEVKEGEEWGVFFARDYEQADQNAITVSSDWRFGNGRRHYGRAFFNNYRLEQEYARAMLGTGTAAVQLLEVGDLVEGRIAPLLAVQNTGSEARKLTVRCAAEVAYGSGNQEGPRERVMTVPAGERREHRFEPISLPPDETSTITVSAKDAAGQVIFAREIPIRPGYRRKRLRAVPDVYFSGYHFGGKRANDILLSTCYDPIENEIYCRTRPAPLPNGHRIERAEAEVRRAGDPAPVATVPVEGGQLDYRIHFHDLSHWRNKPATVL
jgi:hypothetical protein